MRITFTGLLAAGLLSSQIAAAATVNTCARPGERSAFDVEELKSELMVTAISCKANDQYNSFIGRYKSDIAAEEKNLNGYFSRTYGRQAQRQHDEYITSLANAQSQQGLKQGTAFCGERAGMFEEVMALRSPQDLPDYARGKNLAVPAVLDTCTGAPPVMRKASARRAAGHKKSAEKHS